ncbi:uncharacterized protein PAN0_015d5161 [Moesziomyces antarcticus]|uniref:Uncharacterized protein n=2 Tax=Pseudozyma antarctica TaxID=84753 RepID=A0A5C3FU78_PSEA2|nr:uncharacterized protein PAN0_015d5161 [Moesziomyces antarcticus]GAK66937.1 conserved hypothetical protein [Moesziomyces antarcticus]SPO47988.1 uncharacterized protein PSANT_05676 [Moesziomyces antarcticus]
MALPLHDGSLVGDGSQIGMFPVLADQHLEKHARLLRSAANPRMDLVLLILKDAAAAASTSAAPAPPPGMSAAQFALVQRMLAARQRGANAASAQGGGAIEPKRGPQINLVLWRMGDDSTIVWSSPLSFEKLMDPSVASPLQEHEDLLLHDVVWSPAGDRLALLATLTRSPVASSSTAKPRTSTFLRTYSIQDGRLLSTVQLHHAQAAGAPMSMQWLDTEFAADGDMVDGSAEALLAKLPPLPQLPPADTFASASATGNLMPHQLRMMQMAGQKPPPSFQYPSQLALQGRGPLSTIPTLAKSNADLGLLEGADGSLALNPQSALPLTPQTVVVVAQPAADNVHLVLDGQVCIGVVPLASSDNESPQTQLVSLSRDMSRLEVLSTSSRAALTHVQISLPLRATTRYAPSCIRRRIAAVSRASYLARFYLGYALDTASALQQLYQKEYVQKVTSEWAKNIDDISSKFGGDMKYELINVLLTGRAGPAAEQFLLGNLTEGVLTRLEQHTHAAMYALKKHIADSLRPSLERAIVCIDGLRAYTRFFDQHDGDTEQMLTKVLDMLQQVLAAALQLADEMDQEALVSQEFYRWCRTERDRQERIKQDQDEPRLPIVYDVHYVAKHIDRGFENDVIAQTLANNAARDATKPVDPRLHAASLAEALQQAKSFLSDPHTAHIGSEPIASGEQETVSIVPMLTAAITILGEQMAHLLDADLQTPLLHSSSNSVASQASALVMEDVPATSFASIVEQQPERIRTASFLSTETMLAAFIVRSDDTFSILVIRRDLGADAGILAAHFAIAQLPGYSGADIIDVGFYGDTDLLVLATLEATSVLLAFALPHLPFSAHASEMQQIAPTRATEFEPGFRASSIAVNTNKQTVALAAQDGTRLVYLDMATVEPYDTRMHDQH